MKCLSRLLLLTGLCAALITDYRTMPPGTYTETLAGGTVRVVIVAAPTVTVTRICPAVCDCSRIENKESQEYVFMLLLIKYVVDRL